MEDSDKGPDKSCSAEMNDPSAQHKECVEMAAALRGKVFRSEVFPATLFFIVPLVRIFNSTPPPTSDLARTKACS